MTKKKKHLPRRRKPEKSDELSLYRELILQLLRDAAIACHLQPSSFEMDRKTIIKRSSSEGLPFFTVTLPSLGKCLDKTLSSDRALDASDTSFKLSKKYKGRPVFLASLWHLVLDEEGLVRDRGVNIPRQVAAVRAIRQICFLLYKLEEEHSEETVNQVLSDFVRTDMELPEVEQKVPLSPRAQAVIDNARVLIHYALRSGQNWLEIKDITPRHGPGAVSTGEKVYEKPYFRRTYEQLEEEYPFADYFFYNYSHWVDSVESGAEVESLQHGVAKIVLVPKDSRGPRIISMEPPEFQWIQQGILANLVSLLERRGNPCAGYVNFTSQEVNRNLALTNSFHGKFNTYDMKEASDRVSDWLVKKIFPTDIYDALSACRSKETILPNGHVQRLRKFAPMGSAVCFPIEALTFWALAVGSCVDVRWKGDLNDLPPVFVYGDDIVARQRDYESFAPVFNELFLKFNEEKCSTGRFFRESCGLDSFKLHEVNPIRIKAPWRGIGSPAATLSYIDYVNSLSDRGYAHAAKFLLQRVTQELGPIPVTNRKDHSGPYLYRNWSNGLTRQYLFSTFKHRYNAKLQRTEVRLPNVITPITINYGSPGWEELLRVHVLKGASRSFFGSASDQILPCSYTLPRRVKSGWKWVAVTAIHR